MNGANRQAAEAGWPLRLVRSALLAAATLSVAAWAHTSASGNLPGAGGLAALGLVATFFVAPFLGRPASYRRVVGLVVGGQFGLHVALSVAAGHGARPAPTAAARYFADHSMLAETGHAGHAPIGDADALTAGVGGLLGELSSVDGWRMVAAHLGASVLVGLWLATGERLLWFCLRRMADAARRGLAAVAQVVSAAEGPLLITDRPGTGAWLEVRAGVGSPDWMITSPHRGPPRVAASY